MNTAVESRPAYVAPSQLLPTWDAIGPKADIPQLFDADAKANNRANSPHDIHAPALNTPSSQADRDSAHQWLRQLNAAGNGEKPPGGDPLAGNDGTGGMGGIGGIMSDQALVLMRYFAFFQKAFENDVKFRAALTQLQSETLKGSVDAIKRGGMATMMGNLSGALISVGMAGAGAYQQLKKVPEASALKDGAKVDVPAPAPTPATGAGANSPNPAGTLDVDAPASTIPPSPSPSPATPDVDMPEGGAPPSATPDVDVPEASTPTPATPEGRHPLDDQRFKAQALLQLSSATGGVATGGGNYASAIAQADRQQKDSAVQVHKDSASSTQEQANRDHASITDMIKAIETAMQSRTSAMGVVAGNIRA